MGTPNSLVNLCLLAIANSATPAATDQELAQGPYDVIILDALDRMSNHELLAMQASAVPRIQHLAAQVWAERAQPLRQAMGRHVRATTTRNLFLLYLFFRNDWTEGQRRIFGQFIQDVDSGASTLADFPAQEFQDIPAGLVGGELKWKKMP